MLQLIRIEEATVNDGRHPRIHIDPQATHRLARVLTDELRSHMQELEERQENEREGGAPTRRDE